MSLRLTTAFAPLVMMTSMQRFAWTSTLRARIRLGITLSSLCGLVVLVVTQRGFVASAFGALGRINWVWLPLALGLEWASITAFAHMQRRLFRAGDKRVALRPVLATAFAGNAISVTVPFAGPQLGTAFAFRRFRRLGIDSALAGWTLVVSGVVSSLVAAFILVAAAIRSGNVVVAASGAIGGVVGLGVITVAAAALRWPSLAPTVDRSLARLLRLAHRFPGLSEWRASEALGTYVSRLRTLRLGRARWFEVVALALANWLTDAGVLVVSVLAVGGHVPWGGLLFVYAVRIAAGGVSLTPGGIGVVEGSLAIALVSVGLHHSSAVAAVLLYRFISFWLVAATGWSVYLLGQGTGSPLWASPTAVGGHVTSHPLSPAGLLGDRPAQHLLGGAGQQCA